MTKYESLIIGLAAVLAALLYLVRQLAKVATAVRFISDHPAEHRRLAEATAANTAAIDRLTSEIRRPTDSRRSRRPS